MTSINERVNILMVDDMPAKLLSYEAILEDLNENLIKAGSAREALEHLLKKEIAVVLMDVSMPEVDGFELAAMVHEHPRHRETAIIFVSGVHLSDLDRMKAYQHGAVDYVSVPIVPEILRAKVRVFVELYRKKQQLEQINVELERRVQQRTEELQNRNAELQKLNEELVRSEESLRESERHLQRALSAAEEASRLKDEFLATVSHELRTPLNSILGWSQILESSSLEPEMVASASSAISTSAKNQAQIINDLLDIARIVNAKMDLQPRSVSLAEILSGALNTLAHAISAKNIHVTSKFSEGADTLSLYVDPQRLQQVLWNLLSNAVKFSPFNGVIEIEVTRTSTEATISFKDGGKGISPQFLPFVFERFRQEDSSTTRRFGGLGIGLSIAKHLIELHGGTITAESAGEGKGSRFTVLLPSTIFAEKIAVPEEALAPLSIAHEKPTFANLAKARILLVDDDLDTLDLLRETFKVFGAEVRTSRSALVALGMLNAWEPDILISDLAMPNQDGYWLIRQIRAGKPALREMPAIALTAFASPSFHGEALTAGFNIFLPKPIEPHEILKTTSEFLNPKNPEINQSVARNTAWKKGANLSGKKILLVEDDVIFTEMLCNALEAEGLCVRCAASAAAAVTIVQEWQPDVIISDLGLPGEDGFAFIEKIRSLPSVSEAGIPALALSGYGKEEGNRALAAGFHAYKTKPVEPSELIFFLNDLFAAR